MRPCPALVGDDDWTAIPHPALAGRGPTFLSAQPKDGLQVAYFRSSESHLKARAWFGPATQGPPGHAHGGSMAALLDEVAGGGAWVAGYPVVAATLDVKFRAMLPLGTLCVATGRVERASGRRVHVHAAIHGPDGTCFAEARGIFVILDPDRLPPMPADVEETLRALVASAPSTG